jgi:hypothetical protein
MGECNDIKYKFEEVMGSDWWIHQISDLANWRTGGVFLVCTGYASSVAPAGAWFYTASGLCTEKGLPFFPEIVLIVPPGTKQLNYSERFKDAIRQSFEKSKREVPAVVSSRLDTINWPWVHSDSEIILADLHKLPRGSAIAIAGAQRLRFPKLDGRTGPAVLTHTGLRISHFSADDLMLPHLYKLLRQLLILAMDHDLSVVIFVENFDLEMERLPEDLRLHQNLAVISVPYDNDLRSSLRALFEAVRISRALNLESALQFICQNIPNVADQALARCIVYGDRGLWVEAWNAVGPHMEALRTRKDAGVTLNLAQAAAACGEAESAVELLREAFGFGFETVESFNAAASTAQSVGATDLLDQMVTEMRIAYPCHPMTAARSFGRMMAAAQYRDAAELADAVGANFEAAWARLHDQTTPDWEAFIRIGCDLGREQDAIANCVVHALDIGQSLHARSFLKRIPEKPDTVALRAELLFGIVIKEIGFVQTDGELEQLGVECSSVLGYLAGHPTDSNLRGRVSRWFETCADEGSRIVLLLRGLTSAFRRASVLFEPANATNEPSPWSFADAEENSKKALEFMKAVTKASAGCPLGRAIAPPEYSVSIANEVMQGLGGIVHVFTQNPDLSGIGGVLQCLNLACRIRHEQSWDFEAAIQLAGALASHGKVSDGLNLAENILLLWGDADGEFGAARRAHAWSCMAEAYHRSRNPLTSLLYLILCFESMAAQPAQQHATLLKHKLRLATRILRDLNLARFAGHFIAAEGQLIRAFPRDREAKEWRATELGCRLRLIDETTPPSDIEEFISSVSALLEDETETEWEPPISIAISTIVILRHYCFQMPERLTHLIQRRLPHCSSSSQRIFRYFCSDRPSLSELHTAIHDFVEGNIHDDEGFGLSTLDGLFRRALATACENGDPELFALAANWLSQPALAASRTWRETSGKRPHVQLSALTELDSSESPRDPEQMRDYAQALQRQIERTRSNFVQLPEMPFSSAKYVAAPDEALCVLAHDSSYHLCRLVVRRTGMEGPIQLPRISWNAEQYLGWIKKYPKGYSWDRHFDALGPYDTPDEDEIRQSINLLQPQLPSDTNTVTILPEADLFGFSYFLTNAPKGWVGEATVCVTAPSISWLAAVRQLAKPRLRLKAWLGHPASLDMAVLRPRGELKPIFAVSGGQSFEASTLQQIGQAGVAVVLSHGSQGAFGGFVGLNDIGQFTNEDLADSLGESACVILFVCNAGRNDHRAFNQETFGLIGQLLRRGVRAVIAPPAPLRNDLPALWFPSFYEVLQQGKTVGQAYEAARNTIHQRFSHPCAWGALQLFGDAQLAFDIDNS